jgi:hypothetical protein
LIPTGSGWTNFLARTKIGCLAVQLGQLITRGTTKIMTLTFKGSLLTTRIRSYAQLNVKANASWSFVTRGVKLSGRARGRMARRNGRGNGWRFCRSLDIVLEMMGSLSWNVSFLLLVQCRLVLDGSSDKDFLETWADIDRTILFDSTWVMTSYWLNVPIAPAGRAWTYGDVTCKSPVPLR